MPSRVLILTSGYDVIDEAVRRVFERFPVPIRGRRVLIKPNVLRASEAARRDRHPPGAGCGGRHPGRGAGGGRGRGRRQPGGGELRRQRGELPAHGAHGRGRRSLPQHRQRLGHRPLQPGLHADGLGLAGRPGGGRRHQPAQVQDSRADGPERRHQEQLRNPAGRPEGAPAPGGRQPGALPRAARGRVPAAGAGPLHRGRRDRHGGQRPCLAGPARHRPGPRGGQRGRARCGHCDPHGLRARAAALPAPCAASWVSANTISVGSRWKGS